MKTIPRCILLVLAILQVGACVDIPDGVTAVEDFDAERYLGTWYEIARLDHRFERGLSEVTATYSLRDDGGIKVVNRGFDADSNEWSESVGKAYFVRDETVGRLKVSFFGPFYGAYNIVALDKEQYRYSLVVGPNRSYLWILNRTPQMDKATLDRLLAIAAELDFPTDELIYVEHGKLTPSVD
jgi:apolipoprotein D and lipocalin family protein